MVQATVEQYGHCVIKAILFLCQFRPSLTLTQVWCLKNESPFCTLNFRLKIVHKVSSAPTQRHSLHDA